jgi:hypothetical protein
LAHVQALSERREVEPRFAHPREQFGLLEVGMTLDAVGERDDQRADRSPASGG